MNDDLKTLLERLSKKDYPDILETGIESHFFEGYQKTEIEELVIKFSRSLLKTGQTPICELIYNATKDLISKELASELFHTIKNANDLYEKKRNIPRPRICNPDGRFKDAKKSLLIICSRSKEFSFKSMRENGLAGSETAALAIAQGFKDRGYLVTILNVGDHKEYSDEGIIFKSVHEIQNLNQFFWDVIIAERDTRAFDMNWNSSALILDLHDAQYDDANFLPGRLSQVDEIWTKTNWHKQYISNKYPQLNGLISTVPNGIWADTEEVKLEEKDPNYILFSSDPSRGLRVLLRIFALLKNDFPDLKLDIANGWLDAYGEKYGEGHSCKLTEKAWEARKLWESEEYKKMNVNFIGRIGQDELKKLQRKSGLWLMPTDFPETSCITAMEFVRSRTPMVISVEQSGALSGTAPKRGCYRIAGEIDSPEFQKDFYESCKAILKSKESYKKAFDEISKVNPNKYSWQRAANTALARAEQVASRNLSQVAAQKTQKP